MRQHDGTNHGGVRFKTRIVSLVLSIVMMLSMMPVSVFAASDGLTIQDGVLTGVTWYDYNCPTEITIPEGVTTIGQAAFSGRSSKLKKINLPSTLTTIEEMGFADCYALESLELPESVKSIGNSAFYDCRALESINIPEGVISLGEQTFYLCENLETIKFLSPFSLLIEGDYTFGYCGLSEIRLPSVYTLPTGTFYYCDKLEMIELPEQLKTIGDNAFMLCSNLNSIVIHNNVETIKADAFDGCTALTNVYYTGSEEEWNAIEIENGNNYLLNAEIHYNQVGTIASGYCGGEGDGSNLAWTLNSEGLLTISGEGEMKDFSNSTPWYLYRSTIKQVIIEDDVTSFDDNAFNYLSELEKIVVGDGITTIEGGSFKTCKKLNTVVLGENITEIGNSAFRYCSSLKNIVIPDSVTVVDNYAFASCSKLESIILGDNVETIGGSAFESCKSLKTISFPNGVTSIKAWTFDHCSSLTDVFFSNGIEKIESYAFMDCEAITDVYYSGSEEEWSTVSVGGLNNYLLNANFHFNYNGETDKPEESIPTITGLIISVITPSIISGETLSLSILSTIQLDSAYLQFDNGKGDWLGTSFCSSCSSYAISPYSYSSTEDGFLYNKSLNVSTAGREEDDYVRKVRVISKNEDGEWVCSKEASFAVYGEKSNLLDASVSVTADSNKRGEHFCFGVTVDRPFETAFLVFDNPASGDWLGDSDCIRYFAITEDDYSADSWDDTYEIEKTIQINQAGNKANSYKRKVKLVLYDEEGNRYETPAAEFVVSQETDLPEPIVENVTYQFKKNKIEFTVTTTDTEAVRIYRNNQFVAAYDTEDDVITIEVTKAGYMDVPLTFKAYDVEFGEGNAGVSLTVSASEDPSLGNLEITKPILPSAIVVNEDLTVNWKLNGGTAEEYLVEVTKGAAVVYSATLADNSSSITIPGSCFSAAGQYDISITARHSEKTPASATISVQVTKQAGAVSEGNPTKQEVYDYVVAYLESLNYSNSASFADLVNLCCSVLWKESSYIHVVNGEINQNANSGNKGTDWGISQLNENSHKDKMGWAKAKDWKLAVAAGVDVALEKYHQLAIQNAAKTGAEAKGYSYETARACATYSAYNTGSNPKRFYTESDGRDTGFYNIYVNKPWLQGVSTSAINELSKANYVTVGTVSKAQSYGRVRVYSSASSDALNCGWLDVGETIYIIGNPGGGAYYSFYTDHGACGYVQAAYIQTTGNVITSPKDNTDEGSTESVPVEDLPDTVCTASDYEDVKTGDTVTFTVEAKEGSSNFKIKINDLDPVACTADFSWGKYKLDYIFKTTGANKVLITWTAPDGQVCSAKCKFNVTVSPNKKDWNSNYSNGILNIVKKDGKLGIDNLYGLYVEQDGEYIRGVRAKEYPITSAAGENWDVYDDLHLESGKYSYGIVSTACNWAGGHTYTKLGSFTVTDEQAREEKTMYVISSEGADVYGGFSWILKKPNNKFKDLRYEYGDIVTVYVGADRNGYSQVKISGSDTRKAYVASGCLDDELRQAITDDSNSIDSLEVKFNELLSNYKPGEFFSKDIENGCYTNIFKSGKCHKNSVCDYSAKGELVKYCKCLKSVLIGDEVTLDLYSSQCMGYALYCYYELFGVEPLKAKQQNVLDKAEVYKDSSTVQSILLNNCKPGAYVRFGTDSNGHSIIVKDINEEYIEVMQCNKGGNKNRVNSELPLYKNYTYDYYGWKPCVITCDVYTWSDFYDQFKSYSQVCRVVLPDNYDEQYAVLHAESDGITLLDKTNVNGEPFTLRMYDKNYPLDQINAILGFTGSVTQFEVSSRTGSVYADVLIDNSIYDVEIRQGGRIYENGDELSFNMPRLNFEVAIIEKLSEKETVYTFSLTKKAEIDKCGISLLYAVFYNEQGHAIGSNVINDFSIAQTFSVPYSTAKVKFSHDTDGNYSYVRYATEESLTEDRWIPVDIMADMDSDRKDFTLGIYSDAGTEAGKFTYTLERQPKSSEADLNSLEVSAYDISNELIGSEMYTAENTIRVDLPYGTSAIDMVTSVSDFATETYTLNGSELYGLNDIAISNGDVIEISVIAEDGTVETYTIYISINQIADTISPAIHVVGSSGKIYESGSLIAEEIEIGVSDDSWYWYEITCGGEYVEELVTSDTAYMITAYDVFGNSSTFTFWYSETGLPPEGSSKYIASVALESNVINAGSDVKVLVTMPNELPEMTSIWFEIEYDQEMFAIEERGVGSGWSIVDRDGKNLASCVYFAYDIFNGDNLTGETIEIIFHSKADAVPSEYNFVVKFDSSNTFDANYNEITINGGTVTAELVAVTVPATEVILSETSLTLVVGERKVLTAAVKPDNVTDGSIVWKSSNESVATISSDGTITALNVGVATITATTANGLTDTCIVTVAKSDSILTFAVGNATAAVGEIVSVPVAVINNPGIAHFGLTVEYPADILKPIGVNTGEIFAGAWVTNLEKMHLAWAIAGCVGADGLAFTIDFEVIGDTRDTAEIALVFDKTGPGNENHEIIDVKVNSGTFTVKKFSINSVINRINRANTATGVELSLELNEDVLTNETVLLIAAAFHEDRMIQAQSLSVDSTNSSCYLKLSKANADDEIKVFLIDPMRFVPLTTSLVLPPI